AAAHPPEPAAVSQSAHPAVSQIRTFPFALRCFARRLESAHPYALPDVSAWLLPLRPSGLTSAEPLASGLQTAVPAQSWLPASCSTLLGWVQVQQLCIPVAVLCGIQRGRKDLGICSAAAQIPADRILDLRKSRV